MTTFLARQVILENQVLEDFGVVIANGRIERFVSKDALMQSNSLENIVTTDILMAGFIDIHIHGSAGADVMDATPEALSLIQRSLVSTGTTGFLATTMTVAEPQIVEALKNISSAMEVHEGGAKILGAHLEGPFIQKKAKGAHLEAFVQPPTTAWVEPFKDIVKLITMSPETDENYQVLKAFKAMGIKVSLGHTTATYDCACGAVEAGADSITHLFNAMTGLHHRDPGMVGAALLKPVYTEMIADDVHVHPDLYELVYKLKGEDKIILITDAMKGQCMWAGQYDLGGQAVLVSDKDARLLDGTLAGSILTQNKAMINMLRSPEMDLVKVSKMLSTNPANLLGLKDRGKIAVGAVADLVCLNNALEIKSVWVEGTCEFKSEK